MRNVPPRVPIQPAARAVDHFIDDVRRPMCRTCAEHANEIREQAGVEGRWEIYDAAYAPAEGLPE